MKYRWTYSGVEKRTPQGHPLQEHVHQRVILDILNYTSLCIRWVDNGCPQEILVRSWEDVEQNQAM